MEKNNNILMAMSGGIDSSVSAIELKKQGYNLKGVTFTQLESESAAVRDARAMADSMGFEHHALDIRDEFNNTVVCNFINEYLHGRTPNPCVMCNPTIKWGRLLKFADELGCYWIATGHYARIGQTEDGRYFLRKGLDDSKDQTYFLWRLSQENLARTKFPLGNYNKPHVRELAQENGYEVLAKKSESQEICFIPDNDYRKFLQTHVDNFEVVYGPGDFVDKDGRVLGRHKGFPNYTIGQRKGLGIALGEPAFVIRIDAEKNQVVLGRREDLLTRTCFAKDVNMMKYADFTDGYEVMAKIRYKSKPGMANIYHDENDKIRVVFQDDIESITPGQSVVFYCGDDYADVLGGGILC